ncbi:MAG: CopK family periplasmic copper-binding protein [Burkholderiaceae bacterium]
MTTQTVAALILSAALCAIAGSASAVQGWEAKKVELKDGRTLLIFADGKMSLRDAKGQVLQGRDGDMLTSAKSETTTPNPSRTSAGIW